MRADPGSLDLSTHLAKAARNAGNIAGAEQVAFCMAADLEDTIMIRWMIFSYTSR